MDSDEEIEIEEIEIGERLVPESDENGIKGVFRQILTLIKTTQLKTKNQQLKKCNLRRHSGAVVIKI